MKDLFREQQENILKILNSPYRKYLDIPHIGDNKIVKAFPNGVAIPHRNKQLKWFFWGKDVIADQLISQPEISLGNFEFDNRFRAFAWLTSTFNPNANPESTSVDGQVGAVSAVWATVRAAATGDQDVSDTATSIRIMGILSGANYFIFRGFILFDTSALNDSDTITSASMQVEVTAWGHSDLYLVTSAPASDTAIVGADYNDVGTVAQTDTPLDGEATGTKTQALNATGIGNISKTGITKFGLRQHQDFNNVTPTDVGETNIASAEHGTAAYWPLLTVVTPDPATADEGGVFLLS